MGNKYSVAYFKCPGCGKKKCQEKIGKPKQKLYKCKLCGTVVHGGKGNNKHCIVSQKDKGE